MQQSQKFASIGRFILPLLLATGMNTANAVTGGGISLSNTNPLTPLSGEIDLMDVAFQEGVAFYESGDYAAAVRRWQIPADRGHAMAQFSLGVAYATGKGVPLSLARAIQWWQAAASGGHLGAQLNLGLLYWRGEGVEKDLTKARMWWQRAANGGDAAAQFHLGALAATGEGEPRNYKEAARWWRLSAAQGYSQAIKGLEILKSSGTSEDID